MSIGATSCPSASRTAASSTADASTSNSSPAFSSSDRRASLADASTTFRSLRINMIGRLVPARFAVVEELDDTRRRLLDRASCNINYRPSVFLAKPSGMRHLLGDLITVHISIEISGGQKPYPVAPNFRDPVR